MPRRLGLLCAVMLLLGGTAFAEAALARGVVLAQEVGEGEGESDVGGEESNQQSEGGVSEGDEGEDQESGGQDEPEAETGSGADQTEEAATETGPPWTYQMARLALASLALLGLAIAGAYYRFVVMRQRGAV
ncbi:MAG TPA: hypothetical protein VHN37_13755 [Actinomycetota bacterium]|nr:hypothetical protein [Actinomycetota bacterium]